MAHCHSAKLLQSQNHPQITRKVVGPRIATISSIEAAAHCGPFAVGWLAHMGQLFIGAARCPLMLLLAGRRCADGCLLPQVRCLLTAAVVSGLGGHHVTRYYPYGAWDCCRGQQSGNHAQFGASLFVPGPRCEVSRTHGELPHLCWAHG